MFQPLQIQEKNVTYDVRMQPDGHDASSRDQILTVKDTKVNNVV